MRRLGWWLLSQESVADLFSQCVAIAPSSSLVLFALAPPHPASSTKLLLPPTNIVIASSRLQPHFVLLCSCAPAFLCILERFPSSCLSIVQCTCTCTCERSPS